MTTWFTGDTHFSHKNVILHCNRPFNYIKEHDEELIKRWNEKVKPKDTIYHLGDFGWGSKGYLLQVIKRLNGKIHFIRGNHDKSMKGEILDHLHLDTKYHEIKIQDKEKDNKWQHIVLCHYVFAVWNRKHWGSWHLHAHSHGKLPTAQGVARIDVGVDCHNFYPISYEEVREIMKKKLGNLVC